jgi:ABC-type transport system involved in multi-copper enzyme maturation permease subunit
VWSAPIAAVIFFAFVFLVIALSPGARDPSSAQGLPTWDQALTDTWLLLNNPFGRYVIAGFAAIVFAGEYQFGTWKNFVPHRRRTTLLLNKFFVIAAFMMFAWTLMAVIVCLGVGLMHLIYGASYGSFDGETVRRFAGEYLLNMSVTGTATLIAAGYAALAAMITRSILSSFFITIIITIVEDALLLVLFILYGLLDLNLLRLYVYTPSFNLLNITNWVSNGGPTPVGQDMIPSTTLSLEASIAIIAAWIIIILGLTLWRFNRQDITT